MSKKKREVTKENVLGSIVECYTAEGKIDIDIAKGEEHHVHTGIDTLLVMHGYVVRDPNEKLMMKWNLSATTSEGVQITLEDVVLALLNAFLTLMYYVDLNNEIKEGVMQTVGSIFRALGLAWNRSPGVMPIPPIAQEKNGVQH